ncbi:MAG TPA: heavy-metal-associated domain-containing protein [Mycobacteriales bacterium]|jgi:copper ion binding protein|nr:heavy-metal-associated domain-containing protein [Mycobacteriales bacterium]
MAAKSYSVTGMTCEHCVHAVSTEIARLDGVESVQVDLAAGLVTVTGPGFSDEKIADAIDEAGYELAAS